METTFTETGPSFFTYDEDARIITVSICDGAAASNDDRILKEKTVEKEHADEGHPESDQEILRRYIRWCKTDHC